MMCFFFEATPLTPSSLYPLGGRTDIQDRQQMMLLIELQVQMLLLCYVKKRIMYALYVGYTCMCGPSNILRAPSLWLPFSSCNNVSSKCSTYYCSLCTPTALRPELFWHSLLVIFYPTFIISLSLLLLLSFSLFSLSPHIYNTHRQTLLLFKAFPSLSFNVPCINAFCHSHLHFTQCYSQQQE